tara:strand:- start:391 stop:2034 length:1644 start_codon:yes stop_codon:yes gene_type:complete
MPLSYSTHTGDNTTSTFTLGFGSNYLVKSHVKLYYGYNILDGTYTTLLVDGTDYNWTSATQVQLIDTDGSPKNLATGVVLTLIRVTPNSSQLSAWSDGSNLTAEALNNADLQNLYVIQEQQDRNDAGITQSTAAKTSADSSATTVSTLSSTQFRTDGSQAMTGNLDVGNNKIENLADPTGNNDGANKKYVDDQVGATSTNATNAATSASNAATSATNAASSATSASTSATNAASSATTATTQASNASTSATNAGSSATTASTQASNASTSATSASTQASNAATSATNAASSATDAATAKAAAESARDSALASLDSFDDRYLGVKSAAPTVDNDGNALVAGALYYDDGTTNTQGMKVYTGSAWDAAYVAGGSYLALSGGTMTGSIAFWASQPTASTSDPNIVQLEDSVSSTSTTKAATPNSVKTAYDKANDALPKAGGTLSGNVDHSGNGYFQLPVGSDAQRPSTPQAGWVRANNDSNQFEGYINSAWGPLGGGAAGGGGEQIFHLSEQEMNNSYTVPSTKNAGVFGPLTIASGVVLEISSSSVLSVV